MGRVGTGKVKGNCNQLSHHMSIYSVKTHSKSTYTVNRMAIYGCRFTVYVDLQCMSIYSAVTNLTVPF